MEELHFLAIDGLPALLSNLMQAGYLVIGPQIRDGAIVYEPLHSADHLPRGVSVEQAPGYYRIEPARHKRYFAWANGPQALKPLLFPAQEKLWESRRSEEGALSFTPAETNHHSMAVIGVRACDIAALRLHDQHFLAEGQSDPGYRQRRESLLIIAVNCTHPADTCFCVSTGDGPQAESGYDLLLDELDDGFLIRSGTDTGAMVMEGLPLTEPTELQLDMVTLQQGGAARQQTRGLPGRNLQEKLFANLTHPRWAVVASRCLSCGSCTSVCPTCFCHGEFDVPAIDTESTEHFRQWHSCFAEGHSYIHGIVIRSDIKSRYRQWMTHKLGGWHEQFGRSGCVGCGRCISWCPVGIDITEEAAAICTGGGK